MDLGPPGRLDLARLEARLSHDWVGQPISESALVLCDSPGPRPGMELASEAEGVSLGVIH